MWVSIACRTDGEWLHLCNIIDQNLSEDPRFRKLADRKQNEEELEELISAWTLKNDRWEITRQLQALSIPAFPSFKSSDIVDDPHLNSRGFIERLEHPEVGIRAHAGIPWILDQRNRGIQRPAPCLGQDTERLLTDLIGYKPDKIKILKDEKVLF